jgi:hypothetical protein
LFGVSAFQINFGSTDPLRRGEIGESGQTVTGQRSREGELAAGQLHPVVAVAHKAYDHGFKRNVGGTTINYASRSHRISSETESVRSLGGGADTLGKLLGAPANLTFSEMSKAQGDTVNTFEAPGAVTPKPVRVAASGGKLVLRLPSKSVTVVQLD